MQEQEPNRAKNLELKQPLPVGHTNVQVLLLMARPYTPPVTAWLIHVMTKPIVYTTSMIWWVAGPACLAVWTQQVATCLICVVVVVSGTKQNQCNQDGTIPDHPQKQGFVLPSRP